MSTPVGPDVSSERLVKEEILTTFSTLPSQFIKDFYDILYREPQEEYPVPLSLGAKWLESNRSDIRKKVKNEYDEGLHYIDVPERIHNGRGGHNRLEIYMTVKAFLHLCMSTMTDTGYMVREYFIELDRMLGVHGPGIKEGIKKHIADIEKELELKRPLWKDEGPGTIYGYITDDPKKIKGGQTKRPVQIRLDEQSVGKAEKIKPIFTLVVQNRKEVESCLKRMLHLRRQNKRREIYEVTEEIFKKLVKSCNQLSIRLTKRMTSKIKGDNKLYLEFVSNKTLDSLARTRPRFMIENPPPSLVRKERSVSASATSSCDKKQRAKGRRTS